MKVLYSLCALILSFAIGHSQSAPALGAKARGLRARANKILAETPHRVTMTVEMRATAELPWESYSSQVLEVIGKDRWHLVQHTGLTSERIGIGENVYEKMPNSGWRLVIPGDSLTSQTLVVLSRGGTNTKIIESENDGRVVETTSRSALQVNGTWEMVDMNRRMKEWFDERGRLTRVETVHFNFERKKFQRNVELYEYDSTIKIEAPIN